MKFLHEFLTHRDGTTVDNGWWEIRGDRLVNTVGGYHYYTPKDDDIIAEAESIEDLDWSFMLKPESEYGWLDIKGQFYGCDFQEHGQIARLVLKTSERALEESGWIKLYRDYPKGIGWYCERSHITKAQMDFLLSRNLLVRGELK